MTSPYIMRESMALLIYLLNLGGVHVLLVGVPLSLLVGVPLWLLEGVDLRLNGLFLSPFPPVKSGLDCFLSVAESLLFWFLRTVLKLSCLCKSEDILTFLLFKYVLSSLYTLLSRFPALTADLYNSLSDHSEDTNKESISCMLHWYSDIFPDNSG